VQPGGYNLTAASNGFTTKTIERFHVDPVRAPDETSITLSIQHPLITVAVVDADDRPVPNAPLVLMSATSPKPRTFFAKTDEAGLRRFENLLPGHYTLSVTFPDERTRQKNISLDLGENQVREVTVAFGRQVHVTGSAKKNDRAYSGLLSFTLKGTVASDLMVKTDAKGEFTTDLESGDYMAGTPDKPAQQQVTIKSVETQKVDLSLK
jgi:hypothetical protein